MGTNSLYTYLVSKVIIYAVQQNQEAAGFLDFFKERLYWRFGV